LQPPAEADHQGRRPLGRRAGYLVVRGDLLFVSRGSGSIRCIRAASISGTVRPLCARSVLRQTVMSNRHRGPEREGPPSAGHGSDPRFHYSLRVRRASAVGQPARMKRSPCAIFPRVFARRYG